MSIPDWAQDILSRLGRLEGAVDALIRDVAEIKRKVNGAVRNSAMNRGYLLAWGAVIAAIVSGVIGLVIRLVAK